MYFFAKLENSKPSNTVDVVLSTSSDLKSFFPFELVKKIYQECGLYPANAKIRRKLDIKQTEQALMKELKLAYIPPSPVFTSPSTGSGRPVVIEKRKLNKRQQKMITSDLVSVGDVSFLFFYMLSRTALTKRVGSIIINLNLF